MAQDLDDLGGHLSETLNETRTITDPWGYGMKAKIRSTADQDWKTWDMKRLADAPEARVAREKAATVNVQDFEQSGFRASRKLTTAEKRRKLVEAFSQPAGLRTDVVALREQKPGIAKYLVVELDAVLHGAPVEKTVEGLLALMDHERWVRVDPDTNERKISAIPLYKKGDDGEVLLDDAGDPVDMPFGGMNKGDAIAAWLYAGADEQAAFVEARKKEVQSFSAGASNSFTATGSPSSPAPAEQ